MRESEKPLLSELSYPELEAALRKIKRQITKEPMRATRETLIRGREQILAEMTRRRSQIRGQEKVITPVRKIVETGEPTYSHKGQEPGAYRADRLPMVALLEVSKVLKEGAERHKDDNGQKWMGTPVEEHLNRALVHIFAHLAGDTQESHLAHAATRLLFSLQCHVVQK